MTSATEVLRRMLDERGVEHEDDEGVTRFFGPDGFEVVMQEGIDGELDCLTPLYLTPAQAIAATLGTGTCELINAADDLGKGTSSCMCFECGYIALDDWWNEFKYCPNCGRKVVDA